MSDSAMDAAAPQHVSASINGATPPGSDFPAGHPRALLHNHEPQGNARCLPEKMGVVRGRGLGSLMGTCRELYSTDLAQIGASHE